MLIHQNNSVKQPFLNLLVVFTIHSRFTGYQGKGEVIILTFLYHFHPIHRYLDIIWEITAESSPLHIANSQNRTGKSLIYERKSVNFLET